MAEMLVGRLYSWPEFAEDGRDIWLIHLGEPGFFLRVIRRPEGGLPTGEVSDIAFPLRTDPRFALGNLKFLDPGEADPADLARLVAGAIDAVNDLQVIERLALDELPFDPAPDQIVAEDLPRGFVVGVMYETGSGRLEENWWVAHVGLPPFLMRISDLTDEDVEPDDVWASVESGAVLTHPRWLSPIGCDPDELRHLAQTAADVVRESAIDDMAVL